MNTRDKIDSYYVLVHREIRNHIQLRAKPGGGGLEAHLFGRGLKHLLTQSVHSCALRGGIRPCSARANARPLGTGAIKGDNTLTHSKPRA
jgi:hypothetical protein